MYNPEDSVTLTGTEMNSILRMVGAMDIIKQNDSLKENLEDAYADAKVLRESNFELDLKNKALLDMVRKEKAMVSLLCSRLAIRREPRYVHITIAPLEKPSTPQIVDRTIPVEPQHREVWA